MNNLHINTAAMAQNLLARRNVSHQPRGIKRKLQNARRRRGKEPLAEYHEILVTVPRMRREPLASSVNESEVKRRVEKMRGLFNSSLSNFDL